MSEQPVLAVELADAATGTVVRSWDELVAEGREIIEGFQWKLGDLACEVETTYGESSLMRYAAEIVVEYSTLRGYKAVAQAFPAEIVGRQTHSFGVYQALAAQRDRLELVAREEPWTVREARELVADRSTIQQAPPQSSFFEPSTTPPAPPWPPHSPPPSQPEASQQEPDDPTWPEGTAPRWGSVEARTAEVVQCWKGHLAGRETFEDVGGCPYCLHTAGERQAALKAREALLRRMQHEEPAGEEAPKPVAHVGYNSGDNEWYTPDQYIKAAKAVMGDIDLDPASSEVANTVVGAYRYYTADDDGLSQPWQGRVWLNPPYAQPYVAQFAGRLLESFASGDVTEACVLVNNATETAWCSSLIMQASAICFPRGRVKFWHPDKQSAPLQGQVIIYLGSRQADFKAEFTEFGPVKGDI